MRVLIRVDSGAHIGMGHLMRMKSLANGLIENVEQVIFVAKDHPGANYDVIKGKFELIRLDSQFSRNEFKDNDYGTWIDTTEEEEAQLINTIIKRRSIDVVIVDHYGLSANFESLLDCQSVIVVDDVDRSHSCHVLVDPVLGKTEKNYIYSNYRKALMGPQYALLDERFQNYRNLDIEKDVDILVYFGGADEAGNTLKVAKALSSKGINQRVFFVLSSDHENIQELKYLCESHQNFKVSNFVDDMAMLIKRSYLAFGAGGASCWERACLGVPSVLITIAANQEEVARQLSENELCYWLGRGTEISQADWEEFLEDQFEFYNWKKMGRKSATICDGRGVERVIDAICQISNQLIE